MVASSPALSGPNVSAQGYEELARVLTSEDCIHLVTLLDTGLRNLPDNIDNEVTRSCVRAAFEFLDGSPRGT